MTIKEYFERYPGSNQCFKTADGLLFHEEGDARLHARSLKDNTVTAHKAGAQESKAAAEAKAAEKVEAAKAAKALKKAAAKK